MLDMLSPLLAYLSPLVAVGCAVGTAIAQPAAPGDTGAILAGAASPWRNAHFVLYAYGAVWVGLALYLWRLASLARRLSREIDRLETSAEAVPTGCEEP